MEDSVGCVGDMSLVAEFLAAKDLVETQGVKGFVSLAWSRGGRWGHRGRLVGLWWTRAKFCRVIGMAVLDENSASETELVGCDDGLGGGGDLDGLSSESSRMIGS